MGPTLLGSASLFVMSVFRQCGMIGRRRTDFECAADVGAHSRREQKGCDSNAQASEGNSVSVTSQMFSTTVDAVTPSPTAVTPWPTPVNPFSSGGRSWSLCDVVVPLVDKKLPIAR